MGTKGMPVAAILSEFSEKSSSKEDEAEFSSYFGTVNLKPWS
jgi:hypothetical protein